MEIVKVDLPLGLGQNTLVLNDGISIPMNNSVRDTMIIVKSSSGSYTLHYYEMHCDISEDDIKKFKFHSVEIIDSEEYRSRKTQLKRKIKPRPKPHTLIDRILRRKPEPYVLTKADVLMGFELDDE